jgi:hypothetical protein
MAVYSLADNKVLCVVVDGEKMTDWLLLVRLSMFDLSWIEHVVVVAVVVVVVVVARCSSRVEGRCGWKYCCCCCPVLSVRAVLIPHRRRRLRQVVGFFQWLPLWNHPVVKPNGVANFSFCRMIQKYYCTLHDLLDFAFRIV